VDYQPQSSNYYERLGLGTDVSELQIKSAFFTAVREYPPEKEADLHKLIREAYDVLVNPHSRTEYDTRLTHGDALTSIETDLSAAEKNEDNYEQERLLKKLINLAPKFGIYRNKLGLVYMELDQWNDALSQFSKAIKIDSVNPVYQLNAGFAAKGIDNLSEAENYFLKAYELDPEDYSPSRALASLYFFDYENAEKAHQILDVAINADGQIDFQDFFCIYDKLKFYTFKRDEKELDSQLTVLHEIISNEQEKSFVAFMLRDIAFQLYEINVFELAQKFIVTAVELTPDDEDLVDFKNEIVKHVKIVKSLKTIQKSSKVHDFIQHLMTVYVANYYGEFEDAEYREQTDQAISILRNIMDVDPHATQIKESFAYIKRNHPHVYRLNNEFFDKIQNFPAASSVEHACPNCREKFNFPKYNYGSYSCPSCHTDVSYDSTGVSRASSYSTSSGGCYIATAVYGDYEHENVKLFRGFRDEVLLESSFGRLFVKVYYALSPFLAKRLNPESKISTVIRCCMLDKLAKIIKP
jgi:tetratricopeptide (TPR) repeat protein